MENLLQNGSTDSDDPPEETEMISDAKAEDMLISIFNSLSGKYKYKVLEYAKNMYSKENRKTKT
jgi:hypothetical protein